MVKCELTQVSVREKKAFTILACLKVYFMLGFDAKKDTCTKREDGGENVPGISLEAESSRLKNLISKDQFMVNKFHPLACFLSFSYAIDDIYNNLRSH